MTKKELVGIVANKMDIKKPEVEEVFNTFLDVMIDTMANGERVKIAGFGSFEAFLSKERKVHNPCSRKTIIVPTHRSVKFRAGKRLRSSININN